MAQELLVATFDNLDSAQRAARDFRNFETDGVGLKIESGVMVQKHADGTCTVLDQYTHAYWGTVVGAVTGGLIGLLGGPVGAIAGMTIGAGAALGGRAVESLLDSRLTQSIEAELKSGSVALILEAKEESTTEVDEVVRGYGGTLFRQKLAW